MILMNSLIADGPPVGPFSMIDRRVQSTGRWMAYHKGGGGQVEAAGQDDRSWMAHGWFLVAFAQLGPQFA
jgi:hypothetical protein